MTIIRTIDRKEYKFKLTDDEIWNAHREFERAADIETVDSAALLIAEDEGVEPFSDEEIESVAEDLRDAMDNSMEAWSEDNIQDYIYDRLMELRD